MEVQPEFRNLLELLNSHHVEYMIVGGYAMAFHGVPRLTVDIDILIDPSRENASRIMNALVDYGFGDSGLRASDFTDPDQVIQLGVPPVRVDIITSIAGVPWETASIGRVAGTYGDVPVTYIGREALLSNKRAASRRKDMADLEALGDI